MIHIHTDGSCLGNPGAGGWAAVIVDEQNRREEIFGGEVHTTNNRMELTAAIRALEKIPAGAQVELFTDSSYLKNAFTNGWLVKWKRNGWNNGRVLNQDLWRELDNLVSSRAVKFNWVKGHAGNFYNERCDTLARTTAEKFQRGEKIFTPPKKISELLVLTPAEKIQRDEPKDSEPLEVDKPPKTSAPTKKSVRYVQLSLFD